MISRQFFRSLHTSVWLPQATQSSLLATLRKKTGYTFVNCKKALELHDNNIVKAEQWLKDQAQQHGWDQAMKLKTRSTTQGVIAMILQANHAALVEINCETDFVARNQQFHNLAQLVVSTVLRHGIAAGKETALNKTILSNGMVKQLRADDGKSLADHAVLTIGRVGENINIRRAACIAVRPEITLYGYTHPAPLNPGSVSFGKYGALVALESKKDNTVLGLQLCQHIIGMNPVRVGNEQRDEPCENIDEESLLIYQEFLLDPDVSIQQVLKTEEAKVLDFVRFEVGETLEGESVDNLETCG